MASKRSSDVGGYGSTTTDHQQHLPAASSTSKLLAPHHQQHSSIRKSLVTLKGVNRVSFNNETTKSSKKVTYNPLDSFDTAPPTEEDNDDEEDNITSDNCTHRSYWTTSNLRKVALDLSLWVNIIILLTKVIAYIQTLSLSVLAALVDSILDVVSQWILSYTEQTSSKTRSSAHYPAGASRLEPLGVLSCAALMGFASFGVLKEAFENLYNGIEHGSIIIDDNWGSFWSMFSVVLIKIGLWALCTKVGTVKQSSDGETTQHTWLVDSTMEALAQDHWNDCLSNMVASIALLCTFLNEELWFLDPLGAIIISMYIIRSWYNTGKEQIEQLTGKAAPRDFIDELHETAANFDPKMEVSTYSNNLLILY
jgi:cation diffusion facilitator family transporter